MWLLPRLWVIRPCLIETRKTNYLRLTKNEWEPMSQPFRKRVFSPIDAWRKTKKRTQKKTRPNRWVSPLGRSGRGWSFTPCNHRNISFLFFGPTDNFVLSKVFWTFKKTRWNRKKRRWNKKNEICLWLVRGSGDQSQAYFVFVSRTEFVFRVSIRHGLIIGHCANKTTFYGIVYVVCGAFSVSEISNFSAKKTPANNGPKTFHDSCASGKIFRLASAKIPGHRAEGLRGSRCAN